MLSISCVPASVLEAQGQTVGVTYCALLLHTGCCLLQQHAQVAGYCHMLLPLARQLAADWWWRDVGTGRVEAASAPRRLTT